MYPVTYFSETLVDLDRSFSKDPSLEVRVVRTGREEYNSGKSNPTQLGTSLRLSSLINLDLIFIRSR